MQIGRIDERCAKAGAVPPTLTPEQAAGHTWKPDATTWAAILRHSLKKPATVTITGYGDESMAMSKELSRGQVTIQTSRDAVGAPVFFRDVPLISVPVGEKGVIMPIPSAAVPFIAWRLRYVGENESRLMMQACQLASTAIHSRGMERAWGWTWTARATIRDSMALCPSSR